MARADNMDSVIAVLHGLRILFIVARSACPKADKFSIDVRGARRPRVEIL